jgi:hypothetical protein
VVALAVLPLCAVLFGAPAAAQDAVDGPDTVADDPSAYDDTYDYDYDVDTDPTAVSEFRDKLEPHGTWVEDPTYGLVWIPDVVVVGEDFQPYRTNGRWGVTDAGDWIWISDYDWGYIPFHYGRWIWIPSRGWAWVPGRVYAPAWVVWRTGAPGYAYVGWAPAPPAFVWFGGVAVGFYATVTIPWWYCPSAYFFTPYWHTHVVHDHYRVRQIHSHTHVYHHRPHHSHAKASGHSKASAGSGSAGHAKAGGTSGAGSSELGRKTPGAASAAGGAIQSSQRSSQRSGGYAAHSIPRSPSFKDARIPESAQPKARVHPDPRAVALRQSAPKVGRGGSGARISSRGTKARSAPRRAVRRPRVTRRPVTRGTARSPGVRRLPPRTRSLDRSSRTAPSRVQRGTPSRVRRAPPSRVRMPTRSTPTRRYRPPSSRRSPRTSPSRSRPSRKYRAPTRRTSPRRVSPSRSRSRSRATPSRSRSSSRSRGSSRSRSRSSGRSRSRR